MSKMVYEDDFKEKILKSTKKIIGIGALAMVLSGCQTLGGLDRADNDMNTLNQKAFEVEMVEKNRSAILIGPNNYKEVFEKLRSGLYINPFNEKTQTLSFYTDNDSFDHIVSDMNNINMSIDGYLCQLSSKGKDLDSNYNSKSPSQQPASNCEGRTDPGLIFLNSEIADDNSNAEKLGLTEAQFNYLIYAHETVHSVDSLTDALGGFRAPNLKEVLEEETRADVGASILMVQLLTEEGYSSDKIENFLENFMEMRNKAGVTEDGVRLSSHLTTVGISSVLDVYKKNKDSLIDMEMGDVLKYAKIVAVESSEYDFSYDFDKEHKKKEFNFDYKKMDENLEEYGLIKNGKVIIQDGESLKEAEENIEEIKQRAYDREKYVFDSKNKNKISSGMAQSHIVKGNVKEFKGFQSHLQKEIKVEGMDYMYSVSDRNQELSNIKELINQTEPSKVRNTELGTKLKM